MVGPDTPARGEVTNSPVFHQRDIAPTVLSLLGLDPSAYPGVLGAPIPLAMK